MELSTHRKEIKYIIPAGQALSIRNHLDKLLSRDNHCTSGSYSVRNLYFESVNDIDFLDKLAGIDIRKKIRLRIYNGDPSLCKLEIKQKMGDWQLKQSCAISRNDAGELVKGNCGVLRRYFYNTETAVKAYSIIMQGQYRPVVQIEYDRIAYRYPMYDTRVTLDMNIRASETNMDIFSHDISYVPIMNEDVVLEVKYSGKLMGFISDSLSYYNLTQSSYSKYCSGRKIYFDFIF